VPYAEVAAEATEGEGPAPTLALGCGQPVTLDEEPVEVGLEHCPEHCRLGRGELGLVAVKLSTLKVRGRVYDTLTGEKSRLPDDGVELDAVWALEVVVSQEVGATIGKGEKVGVGTDLLFTLADSLFDGVDWASYVPSQQLTLSPDEEDELVATVAAGIAEDSALTVTIERY